MTDQVASVRNNQPHTAGGLDTDDHKSEADDDPISSHLIIGLVLGLLLLVTVVGLVIRAVHESWQRRHYRRMDFLIDGMYDN